MGEDLVEEHPAVVVDEFDNSDLIFDDSCNQENEQNGLEREIRALAQVSIKKKSSIMI